MYDNKSGSEKAIDQPFPWGYPREKYVISPVTKSEENSISRGMIMGVVRGLLWLHTWMVSKVYSVRIRSGSSRKSSTMSSCSDEVVSKDLLGNAVFDKFSI